MGALLNMPLIDRFGLGTVSLKDIVFLSQDSKFYSSDTRGRRFLPNCSLSCSSSSTFLSAFRFILWYRWDWNVISGSYHEALVGIAADDTLFPFAS